MSTSVRDISKRFGVALMAPAIMIICALGTVYILRPSEAVENVAVIVGLLGSVAAVGAAAVAIYRLLRGTYRRTWKALSYSAVAALSAMPALLIGANVISGFVYSRLPVTDSELQAIQIAEQFIERNGYTLAGHPKDLPVLRNDIMDPLVGSAEDLKEMRRGTLQAKAFGVRSVDSGVLVFFESIPAGSGGFFPTVEVDAQGYARMMHSDVYAGWYKRTER